MDNVFGTSYHRATTWVCKRKFYFDSKKVHCFMLCNREESRGTKAAALVFLGVGILIICFVGGYFIGRGATPYMQATDDEDPLQFGIGRPTWKDAVCLTTEARCPPSFARSPVILMSLDGFAAEYFKLKQTPALERLRRCGASPLYINPVFPTKTFPNHYTIVTGLYPAFHGIVDNDMYDPVTKTFFSKSLPEARNKSWWYGEPIWLTAKKQGLRTATYFWPGSEVTGQQADYYKPYNRSSLFIERVQQVLRWLDEPKETRPELITVYFEEPDISGHRQGPHNPKIKEALRNIDSFVDLLMEGLFGRHLIGCVNLIIVSDHGMESINCDRVVSMHRMNPEFHKEDFYSKEGTVGRLRPVNPNYTYSDLKLIQNKFQCKSPHAWVYLEDDLPVRWHYWRSQNPRIDPVLFDIDPQWLIANREEGMDLKYCRGGDHGYDPLDEDMWGMLIGSGPSFKKNFISEPFLNIEIYNLIATLLNIEPNANNGTITSILPLLRHPTLYPNPTTTAKPFIVCPRSTTDDEILSGCPITLRKEEILEASINASLAFTLGGLPVNDDSSSIWETCLLSATHSVTGFSMRMKMPMWKMLKMSEKTSSRDRSYFASEVEWSNDPRLSSDLAPSCNQFGTQEFISEDIVQVPLIPYSLSLVSKVYVISDVVPMYKEFYESTLQFIWNKFEVWNLTFQQFSVITGPVWLNRTTARVAMHDHDEIPTHYFFVVTFSESASNLDDLDVVSFILPHHKSLPDCWDMDKYLEKHQARVRDVETVSGLKFFSELPEETSRKLRYKLVQTSAISLSSETKSRRV